MSKKMIIWLIVIIAAVAVTYFIWNSQKSETPKTPEEVQKEIDRLQKLIREVEEDTKKVEEGQIACILVYDPVCGKDGRTYSNSCFAGAAGVEIANKGECK